ncbi:glycine-rich domain-containing protein [Flavobacterium flavipallidum]|uniref:T9SS sorting signal type C domain-containing protein n=1 Tax=Flavobacterium flavipallidum TaxID=3139140 RepID=A0ABU9HKH1_9FLAO
MKKHYFSFYLVVDKAISLFFFSFIGTILSYSQTTKTFTSSGTIEIPAGVTSMNVQCWGAGGGGGGSNFLSAAGGGGGGGAYKSGTVIVTPISTNVQISYTVGLGGTGGFSSSMHGLDGGDTVFSTLTANGGKGGKGATASGNYGAGGAGGSGDYNGGNGAGAANVALLGLSSGSGGGGAGSGASGGNGNNTLLNQSPGSGGSVGGGSGGTGNLLVGSGGNGSSCGGGGGGGLTLLSLFNSTGGNGGNGQIKVTYTCPTYSITSLSADTNCEQSPTITLHSTPEGLPIGTYAVTYFIDGGVVPPPPATMIVETAGTGTIEVQDIRNEGITTVTITYLSSVECSTVVNASIIFDRPTVPVQGTIIHPTCAVPTGSVELSDLPSGSWTIYPGGYTGTGSTATLTGLSSGIQSFVVSNGDCSSQTVSVPFVVVINDPPPTRTWNGVWDVVPTIENKVVFESDFNENVNIEGCSCEVNSGANVTIQSGKYMKLRNELIVDANASLTFENNASLIQINDESENFGKIFYKRYTKPVKRYDFTYWSSPVEGQTLKNLSPYTLFDKYYSYNPDTAWVIHYNGNKEMEQGEGYIIRAPQSFSITSAAIDCNPKFEGMPNNGEITKSLDANKVYLLGNPYPSAISADAFLTENADKLEGTLYFWTHNSPPSSAVDGDAMYNYTSNDYATYNLTGGVNTHAAIEDEDENDPGDNNNLETPTGLIAAGQGFFAPSSEDGGVVIFKNEMRLMSNNVIDNSHFFKTVSAKQKVAEVEKNRLWLNLFNAQGAFKQMLVGYISGATNEYEGVFDGMSYDGNQYVDFYSINQSVKLTVQGRALPFQVQDSIEIGYKTSIAGEFKISIDHADGVLASQKVLLEDKLLNVLHDLSKPYSFLTEKGIFNDRFVLRYQDKTDFVEEIDTVPGVFVSVFDKVIKIVSAETSIKAVAIYDLSGKIVYSETALGSKNVNINNLLVENKALIVKLELENGGKVVKKIIY